MDSHDVKSSGKRSCDSAGGGIPQDDRVLGAASSNAPVTITDSVLTIGRKGVPADTEVIAVFFQLKPACLATGFRIECDGICNVVRSFFRDEHMPSRGAKCLAVHGVRLRFVRFLACIGSRLTKNGALSRNRQSASAVVAYEIGARFRLNGCGITLDQLACSGIEHDKIECNVSVALLRDRDDVSSICTDIPIMKSFVDFLNGIRRPGARFSVIEPELCQSIDSTEEQFQGVWGEPSLTNKARSRAQRPFRGFSFTVPDLTPRKDTCSIRTDCERVSGTGRRLNLICFLKTFRIPKCNFRRLD